MKNLFLKAITLIVSLSVIIPSCTNLSSIEDEFFNRIGKINAKWLEYNPIYTGDYYVVAPNLTSPYTTGTVQQGFLQDGVNMANFVRYLAELPDDLELDDALVLRAQHGAVLLYANGSLSHTPPKPTNMSQEFYDEGYASTGSANIASGYITLHSSIQTGYMPDSSTGNMDRVGHRRWILNPPLKKIGFGYASAYSTMQVFDNSRTDTVSYDFIAWPNKGDFPSEFFFSSDSWSVTLNPDNYQQPVFSDVQVVITRSNNSASWTLDSADNSVSTSGEYFNIENSGYGINNCIIFRPAVSGISYDPDENYSVEISGIKKKDDSAATIGYTVRFFDLTNL